MVLEAWENAEEIGYPVVGEKEELKDNEIPYNIREEQTIDKSSVFTANNNTTTGMATVIPGVNAPKLIASTSIYGDLGGGEEIKLGGDFSRYIQLTKSSPTGTFRTFTLTNLWGDEQLSQGTYGIVLPVKGWYEFTLNFSTGGGTFKVDTEVVTKNGLSLYTDYGEFSSTQHTATFRGNIEANDELYLECTLTYTGSADSFSYTREMSGVITKL